MNLQDFGGNMVLICVCFIALILPVILMIEFVVLETSIISFNLLIIMLYGIIIGLILVIIGGIKRNER